MECCLVLPTLLGVTLDVSLSIAKFDRFVDLEDHVMDHLISVTDLKVFGCVHGDMDSKRNFVNGTPF